MTGEKVLHANFNHRNAAGPERLFKIFSYLLPIYYETGFRSNHIRNVQNATYLIPTAAAI